MFDSLADKMKQDEEKQGVTTAQRAIRWAAYALVTVALFGGLVAAVRFFEG